jgi:superfamily II DNA or RNA helicase
MNLPTPILEKLRPWQPDPVAHLAGLLRRRINCVDLSDTGTGKTYTAVAALAILDVPTLVVCPKPARTAWRRAGEHFGAKFTVMNYEMLRTGRTPYGWWQHPYQGREVLRRCELCQVIDADGISPCPCRPDGEHIWDEHPIDHNYGRFYWHKNIDTIVFDEVHRCGREGTLQSKMLIAARREKKRVLGLSATAACTPLQLDALGYALGLHTHTEKKDPFGSPYFSTGLSFRNWAGQYGCKWTTWGGFQWLISNEERQRQIMADIRAQIIPSCGVRVTTESIPDFPKRSIHCRCFDISSGDVIDKLYEEMEESLKTLDERAAEDKDPNCAFTKILRARQRIELLKVPLLWELMQDYFTKGNSVAVFVNFQETIEQLYKRTYPEPTSVIDGTPDRVRDRDRDIDAFENDLARFALVNTAAGAEAIGLRDLKGNFPRVGLVSPCFSARMTRQIFGRLPRDGSRSPSIYYMVYAADTIEEGIASEAGKHMDNLDALNDAHLMPRNLVEARSKRRAMDWL